MLVSKLCHISNIIVSEDKQPDDHRCWANRRYLLRRPCHPSKIGNGRHTQTKCCKMNGNHFFRQEDCAQWLSNTYHCRWMQKESSFWLNPKEISWRLKPKERIISKVALTCPFQNQVSPCVFQTFHLPDNKEYPLSYWKPSIQLAVSNFTSKILLVMARCQQTSSSSSSSSVQQALEQKILSHATTWLISTIQTLSFSAWRLLSKQGNLFSIQPMLWDRLPVLTEAWDSFFPDVKF